MDEEDKIKRALLKKAMGYSASETTTEFSADEGGNMVVAKKKVTKKHYAPDVSAVKVLLDRYYQSYEDKVKNMSDLELENEKATLEKLKKGEDDGNL